jgi:hypothetical protein
VYERETQLQKDLADAHEVLRRRVTSAKKKSAITTAPAAPAPLSKAVKEQTEPAKVRQPQEINGCLICLCAVDIGKGISVLE